MMRYVCQTSYKFFSFLCILKKYASTKIGLYLNADYLQKKILFYFMLGCLFFKNKNLKPKNEAAGTGQEKVLAKLNSNFFGKAILSIAKRPLLSRLTGNYFFKTRLSKKLIPTFVSYYKISTTDCLESDIKKYSSLNDFFCRKLKPNARPIDRTKNSFVSPADSMFSFLEKIDKNNLFEIKHKLCNLGLLINNEELINQFTNCCGLVFRLRPQDYHRVHSPINGSICDIYDVKGKLESVSPAAFTEHSNPLLNNYRKVIKIKTNSGQDYLVIMVGAMFIGSIGLSIKIGDQVKKGDELGFFEFGGSCVVVLCPQKKFVIDKYLVTAKESFVKVGQKLGKTKKF